MEEHTTAIERLIAIHEAEHPCDEALIAAARQEQAELAAFIRDFLQECDTADEYSLSYSLQVRAKEVVTVNNACHRLLLAVSF